MATRPLKKTLWDNVVALMQAKYGRENLNKLAEEAGIGVASVQRLKEMQTSVGIDLVEKVAKVFRLSAYQILCPADDISSFQIVCDAYNLASNESKALLVGLAEQIVAAHTRTQSTGKGDRPGS